MATQGTKNGFTQVPNQLMESILAYNCPKNQKDIIWALIRYSYGFHKEEASLSINYLSKLLSRDRATISRSLNALIKKKVIVVIREADFSSPRLLALNGDDLQWLPREVPKIAERQQLKKYQSNSWKNDNSSVEESSTNKENDKKNINKKGRLDDFENLWAIYPNGELGNRGNRKRALDAFLKLDPEIKTENLIFAVEKQKQSKQDLRAQKKFAPSFPHLERWIKNEYWTDDIPEDTNISSIKNYEPTTKFMEELLYGKN